MASYKIYFLKFCYKISLLANKKSLEKLQNATVKAIFIEKVLLGLFCPLKAITSRRGTFKK